MIVKKTVGVNILFANVQKGLIKVFREQIVCLLYFKRRNVLCYLNHSPFNFFILYNKVFLLFISSGYI